ncbi:YfdX family protein [Tropicimonas sp. IMCC6043]|uniref:YfdX family protein n=1 Tax=Tropicimonas sp. IMCC6043 TaxID=2510645 RepID=UPI00101BE45D|nr:YfdX family protein [Tropicimonas sp. IMCC6043]RYH09411.1 YfdX family protein [Tropicimonas sp. IMCC6043]
MKTRKTLTALAMISSLAALPLAGTALAEAAGSAAPAQEQAVASAPQDGALIKTVDEAFGALRDVRAARVAIFNGDTELAATLAKSAQSGFEAAQTDMTVYAVDTNKSAGDELYLPFDASMALSEGFVPDTEKAASLTKANAHLANGDEKQAAEELRLANIDVTVTAALVPAKASLEHAQDAVSLIGQGKYYQANIALKAVEDSVIIESYGIDSLPMQGGHDTAASAPAAASPANMPDDATPAEQG